MTDTGGYDEEFASIMKESMGGEDLLSDAELISLLDETDQFRREVEQAETPELLKMMKDVWVGLRALGEGITPETDAGRVLHSKHTAIKTEMLRRVEEDD